MKNEHSLLIAALIGLAGFALTLTLLTLKTTKTAPTAPQAPAVKGRPRDEASLERVIPMRTTNVLSETDYNLVMPFLRCVF